MTEPSEVGKYTALHNPDKLNQPARISWELTTDLT